MANSRTGSLCSHEKSLLWREHTKGRGNGSVGDFGLPQVVTTEKKKNVKGHKLAYQLYFNKSTQPNVKPFSHHAYIFLSIRN